MLLSEQSSSLSLNFPRDQLPEILNALATSEVPCVLSSYPPGLEGLLAPYDPTRVTLAATPSNRIVPVVTAGHLRVFAAEQDPPVGSHLVSGLAAGILSYYNPGSLRQYTVTQNVIPRRLVGLNAPKLGRFVTKLAEGSPALTGVGPATIGLLQGYCKVMGAKN